MKTRTLGSLLIISAAALMFIGGRYMAVGDWQAGTPLVATSFFNVLAAIWASIEHKKN